MSVGSRGEVLRGGVRDRKSIEGAGAPWCRQRGAGNRNFGTPRVSARQIDESHGAGARVFAMFVILKPGICDSRVRLGLRITAALRIDHGLGFGAHCSDYALG